MKKILLIIIVLVVIIAGFAISKNLGKSPNGSLLDNGNAGVLPFDSGVTGKVTIGPICPVMREGDDSCADKAYPTTVQVVRAGSTKDSPFSTTKTDENGVYTLMLPPGEYDLQAIGGKPFPYCGTKIINVEPGVVLGTDISCDTGIR